MMLSNRSIKTILPLRISAIIIFITIIFVIGSYFLVDRFVVRQKLGDLMNLADTKYVHVLDFLDYGKKTNEERAADSILRRSLSKYNKSKSKNALMRMQGYAENIAKIERLTRPHAFGKDPLVRSRFHEVLVTDKKGRIIASTHKSSIGENIFRNKLFREKKNSTFVTDAFLDSDKHTVFAFVSPIYQTDSKRNNPIGYFVTHVDTGLLTMIMNADLGNIIGGKLWFAGFQYRSLDVYIMNKSGLMITQSRVIKKDTVLKQMGSELPLKRGLYGGKGEHETIYGISTGAREAMEIYPNRQGVDVAGASMHIFDEGWTVVIEQDTKDAFAGLYNLRIAAIVGGLFMAIFAGIIAWYFAQNISDSLADMGAASIRIASGDFDALININPDEYNEIAVLANSMNLMAENLKKSYKKENS